jgi:hypothetical protein
MRPGVQLVISINSCGILIPGLPTARMISPSCSRGALREAFGSGTEPKVRLRVNFCWPERRRQLCVGSIRRPACRASQAHAREVLGHRPAPLRGSATSWLDAVQVNAEKSAGWRARSLAPVPGSAVPKPKIAGMERRKALPRPLLSGVSGDHAAETDNQGAPLGAPSPPHVSRGETETSLGLTGAARLRRCGWNWPCC